MVYQPDLHRTFVDGEDWFAGNDLATRWELSGADLDLVSESIDELSIEQSRFDGSPVRLALLESLLGALLARIGLMAPLPGVAAQLPVPYLQFRRHIETHLASRPTVTACAKQLGYSARTLDRACHTAVGRTARQVLDRRLSLEIRRLLAAPEVTIAQARAAVGFADASSFTKFVRRLLGASPTEVRSRALQSDPHLRPSA